MSEKRMKDALENIARCGVPENTNLWPNISARLERKSPMMTLRTRPFVAILIILLIPLILSGIAYALGRSLGYIPGYGVVDKNVQMRILAEPVSQTRDGITITINEVILTSDKLYTTITTENIPNNLMLPMSTTTVTCNGDWVYQLPNGSQLTFEQGGGGGTIDPLAGSDDNRTSFRERGYAKLSRPVNVNDIKDITLHIPCVTSDLPAGALPENWEFHLRFVPAPPGMMEMTALPVFEYTPSPINTALPIDTASPVYTPSPVDTATPVSTLARVDTAIPVSTLSPVGTPSPTPVSATETPELNPISIREVIDAGDSYILVIEMDPPLGAAAADTDPVLQLFDGNGHEISWEMPMDVDAGTPTARTPYAQVGVVKFSKEDAQALPITIKFTERHLASISVPFEFDAGDNPKIGDEWKVNQTLEINGHSFTLATIRVIGPKIPSSNGGYEFIITYPDATISVAPSVDGYTSVNEGFGGGGSGSDDVTQYGIDYSVEYASLPKGKLTIIFTSHVVDHEQVWTLPWQP